MTGVKSIKLQLLVFTVLLGAASVLSLVLFDRSENQFQAMIYEKSAENLAVIDLIEDLESDVFNYHNALYLFLTSGDFKWKRYLDERKNKILASFKTLEDDSQAYFDIWVVIDDFVSADPKTELRETIGQFQVGTSTDSDFQRLFYLLRFNTIKYFDAANEAASKADLTTHLDSYEPDLAAEQESVNLIGAGINHLRSAFNRVFWDVSRDQNSRFHHNEQLYFWGLSGIWALLLIFASAIAWQTVRIFRDHQAREESLVLLGARDSATGLFNERSMTALFEQELARAKRRNYALAVFAFRVEPCSKIRKDLGQVALDRLLHMISDTLRSACRVYDGLYRAGEDYFVMTCAETQPRALETLLVRFNKILHKREFLLKGQQVKIIPIIKAGVSFFPEDGEVADTLVKTALTRLTKDYAKLKTLIPKPGALPALETPLDIPPDFSVSLSATETNLQPAAVEVFSSEVLPEAAQVSDAKGTQPTAVGEATQEVKLEEPVVEAAAPIVSEDVLQAINQEVIAPVGEAEPAAPEVEAPSEPIEAEVPAAEPEEITVSSPVLESSAEVAQVDVPPVQKTEVEAGAPESIPEPMLAAAEPTVSETVPEPELAVTEALPTQEAQAQIVPEPIVETDVPPEIMLSANDELAQLADEPLEPELLPEPERAEVVDERPISLASILPPLEPEAAAPEPQGRNPDRGMPNIEVIHSNSEEIIMVDFDREKLDLAEQFRRKLRRQRQEKIAK